MSIGENIKNIRRNRKMTILDVKKITGLSKSTISDIENNKTSPTAATLQKIADALKVSIEDFFQDTDNDDFINKSAKEISEEFEEIIPKIEKLSKEDKEIIKQMIDRLSK